jgi:response regulator RpfG family c-di-GMP phosphodiesterase
MNTILLVDDEVSILNSLRRLLEGTPCVCNGVVYPVRIVIENDPLRALEYVEHHAVDLIVSDYRMPLMDGVAFLARSRDFQPDCVRIILSGFADLNALVGAINEAGIFRFLSKPWNDYELVSTIAQALAYHYLQRENFRLADEMRLALGVLSPQDVELKRLEMIEPGITKVRWGDDGSVLLDDLDDK